jgi:hypothetical protein
MKPEFGFFVTCPDVDMSRLAPFIRIKEGTIGTPA